MVEEKEEIVAVDIIELSQTEDEKEEEVELQQECTLRSAAPVAIIDEQADLTQEIITEDITEEEEEAVIERPYVQVKASKRAQAIAVMVTQDPCLRFMQLSMGSGLFLPLMKMGFKL